MTRARPTAPPSPHHQRGGTGARTRPLTVQASCALMVACLALAGCGSSAVNSAVDTSARQAAGAACAQAALSIKDATAKQSAEQACRAVSSGNAQQLTLAAKQAARLACLQASTRIPDATARAAAKAACPPTK